MEEIFIVGHRFRKTDNAIVACSSWNRAEVYIKAEYPHYTYDEVLAAWYLEPDYCDNYIYIKRVEFIK